MARSAATIELSEEEESELRAVLRTPSASQQQAMRARIVLRAAQGATNTADRWEVGVSLPTVGLWRRKFSERGLEGLETAPRTGRPREIDDAEVQRVLAMTLETPPDGSTHWSARRLAAAAGISASTVHRIWRDHKLKPHQVRSFKFSKDPQLVEKVIDVVGLYLAPPKGALVLCVDEKTQIQALDRTQPTLPIKPGKAQRMTHDYKRNGTTSLYAALEIATGEVTGSCYPQHTHQEFLAFLNQLVRAYPRRPLHVVLDNSSTHSTPEVKRWLERHPRVHFHFTPTSASWMNMVEIWFSILTKQQVRRGVYHDVPELIAAIEHFIDGYNDRAQPFVWTKTAEPSPRQGHQTTSHFRRAALARTRPGRGTVCAADRHPVTHPPPTVGGGRAWTERRPVGSPAMLAHLPHSPGLYGHPRRRPAPARMQGPASGPTRALLVANLENRAVVDGRDLWRDQTVGLLCGGCGSRGCACSEPDPR